MRNPWRFSFDACNGDLYIGDVGQDTLEEIDFLPAAADTRTIASGTNFGWRLMEGPNCRPGDTTCNAQTQAQMALKLPVDSYPRTVGTSVTGGYVYRGSDVPGLRGTYIYADYSSARFFRFRIQDGQIADRTEITAQLRPATGNIGGIASFGTDNAGEMYIAAFTPGAVYRVMQLLIQATARRLGSSQAPATEISVSDQVGVRSVPDCGRRSERIGAGQSWSSLSNVEHGSCCPRGALGDILPVALAL